MRIEFQKLHKEIDATIVYVTHDQVEAMTLGNRISVLQNGKLMQLDTPINLYNSPQNKFVATFIGSPAMNILKGTLAQHGGEYFVDFEDSSAIALSGTISEIMKKKLVRKLKLDLGLSMFPY